ncbi:MAG: disulfide bond formation protein B [Castellaniella sp.]|uniref:disulfide bond formation protein B n=1 Tax=Castellaniella sp. TaxID=1955812 RepID=UPI0011F7F6CB|nr:disulfide bond formation protein B [Castellaniella sp.]TAN30679.1 MAG: disulfide bond formation protein B [Castellaniella sp.]
MTTNRSDRILRFIAFLSLAAVFIALISQHIFGMEPCAWCVLQRFILLVMAVVCLLAGAGWGSAVMRRLGAVLTLLLSASGVAAAWYQYSVAAHSFSCAETFADRFITGLGADAAMPWLFGIYASCMDARRTLLGVEYSMWGLITFVVCGLLALWALARAGRQ